MISKIKCYLESLGCAGNRADAAMVMECLSNAGYAFTDKPDDAGMVVIMTCAFSKTHEQFSARRITSLGQSMRNGQKLVVGGCLPKINSKCVSGNVKVDFQFDPRNIESFANYIHGHLSSRMFQIEDDVGLVRVSTGCAGDCTYCSIRFATGIVRSRPLDQIRDDINSLHEQGIRKVRLVSEEVGAWGHDMGSNVSHLLRYVLKIGPDFDIYTEGINPRWYLEHLLGAGDLLKENRWKGPLYLPIQSGSARILDLMHRGYNRQDIDAILDEILTVCPWRGVSTDLMVGFPSESEEDFLETKTLLMRRDFSSLQLFVYQARPRVKSEDIEPKVTEEEKLSRLTRLLLVILDKELEKKNTDFASFMQDIVNGSVVLPVNVNVGVGDNAEGGMLGELNLCDFCKRWHSTETAQLVLATI